MKTVYYSLMMAVLVAFSASCNKVSYKKTKSGLLYKITSTSSSEPVVKTGDWIKLNFVQKLNDSVLQTSYGKMPVYVQVTPNPQGDYTPAEIFSLLRKGDSVITVMMVDSLVKKGQMPEMPPFMHKGDKITTSFKVSQVFHNDSLYQIDAQAEYQKDLPRQKEEQKEQAAKMKERMRETQATEEAAMEKSGEAAKGIKAMEDFLAAKGIKAQKVGKGTYVVIDQQGTGAQAAPGKYVKLNYNGMFLDRDSTFDSGTLSRELGAFQLITGLEDGIAAFKAGGKGTVYVPGFRAYGANPQPGSPFKPYEPLRFKIELLEVSDTPIDQPAQGPGR